MIAIILFFISSLILSFLTPMSAPSCHYLCIIQIPIIIVTSTNNTIFYIIFANTVPTVTTDFSVFFTHISPLSASNKSKYITIFDSDKATIRRIVGEICRPNQRSLTFDIPHHISKICDIS